MSLLSFENESFVFPQVHHATKFCLLTIATSGHDRDPEFVFFARQVTDLYDDWRRFTLSQEDIARVNPNTGTCPTFRSRRDAEVTKRIYERVPPLVHEGISDGDPWGARFAQGLFNMSGDSDLFLLEPREGRVPLYEGKMLGQFDHRYGTYSGQTEAQANMGTLPAVTEAEHRDADFVSRPRYWVDANRVKKEAGQRQLGAWFIAYRRVVRTVDVRTMIFSALPPVGAGDKAALVALTNVDVHERLAFLALANSFAADYVCRQKIGGISLDFFSLKQVAIPSPAMLREPCIWAPGETYVDSLAPRALELVYTAHDLDAIHEEEPSVIGPFEWNAERRSVIRAELDAAIFHRYGLDRGEVEHVMSTFPVVESYETAEHGEFRQRRRILERYDAMAEAAGSGVPYEAVLDPPPADPRVARVPVA